MTKKHRYNFLINVTFLQSMPPFLPPLQNDIDIICRHLNCNQTMIITEILLKPIALSIGVFKMRSQIIKCGKSLEKRK